MTQPTKISRRVHEAALLLREELGGDRGEARDEAYHRSILAKDMGLKIERAHWAAVSAYLQIIDSGAKFDIRD